MAECASGNADAAKRRLAAIQNLPELDISSEVEPLAQRLLAGAALPEKAKLDALHIAVATIHGIDYLLTWNCKHIANAITRMPRKPRIQSQVA